MNGGRGGDGREVPWRSMISRRKDFRFLMIEENAVPLVEFGGRGVVGGMCEMGQVAVGVGGAIGERRATVGCGRGTGKVR